MFVGTWIVFMNLNGGIGSGIWLHINLVRHSYYFAAILFASILIFEPDSKDYQSGVSLIVYLVFSVLSFSNLLCLICMVRKWWMGLLTIYQVLPLQLAS